MGDIAIVLGVVVLCLVGVALTMVGISCVIIYIMRNDNHFGIGFISQHQNKETGWY